MSSTVKKLFLLLIVAAVVFGLLLYRQIKIAAGITVKNSTEPLISTFMIDIPSDASDQIYGNPGAPLTIVEFIDLGDASSQKNHQIIYSFVKNHPQDARLIFKDAPKQPIFSASNNLGHQAAYCAGVQKKFWPFVEKALADNVSFNDEKQLGQVADAIKLDKTRWWQCANSDEAKQRVSGTATWLKNIGLEAPTVFVNNKKLNLTKDINLLQMLNSFIQK